MKVLSLFDGMSCGRIALTGMGINVEAYHAYEIDKYAVKTAQHNFPEIHEHGDVFAADFSVYRGVDGVIGGSPCTYWSIAQSKNRETTPDGMGGKLFEQYYRAVVEAQPKWFIYENNKSMSKAIREYISNRFGFDPICINSALLSAQNRQRLYWVGKRNADGTYSKVNIEQPKDLGILLKDVLDSTGAKELSSNELQYMVRTTADGRNHFDFGYIQDGTKEKGSCVTANISKGVPYNVCCEPVRVGTYPGSNRPECDSKQYRIYSVEGKSVTLCGQGGGLGAKTGLYAIPANESDKQYTVYSVTDGMITIKGEKYPIKLSDGYYIIRKLTVNECKRLQTVPDWYKFPVSDTQALKMLGNGWTISVIQYLLSHVV